MIYEQSTGLWKSGDGRVLAECYSGAGEGKNNPDLEQVIDVGPVPVGRYTLLDPEYTKPGETSPHGPYVIPLKPDADNAMHGRGGFLAHGDNMHASGTGSEGCIVPLRGKVDGDVVLTGRPLREALWEHGKTEGQRLQVVPGPWPLPVVAS
jgi:hypothetical protein